MFFHLHIVENMFGDNYKKNHKEYAAEECPIARGRGLGSKRTPDILIRVKAIFIPTYGSAQNLRRGEGGREF